MSSYIRELQRGAARAEQARVEAEEAAARKAAAERFVPLDLRLARLLASIPDADKKAGLSLEALRHRLRGNSRPTCSSAALGLCLRRAGWTRVRSWKGDGGFSALWFHPTTCEKDDCRMLTGSSDNARDPRQ
jgi:hypothetical protein